MGQAKKPLDVITNEICQMFSALKHEDQELMLDRLEDLMEMNKGKEATERFRREVIAQLAKMQTRH